MKRQAAFTLVEVLVSVLVFGLLAAAAYTALNGLSAAAGQQREHAQALADLQLAVARLDQDLRQLVPRPVRTAVGQEPALAGETNRLVATRAGWDNPADRPRSQLQRFGWSHDDGVLERFHWAVTDPVQTAPDRLSPALEDLDRMAFRYRDGSGNWHDRWPLGDPASLPSAIEVTLDSQRFGTVRRLVVLE
ncbi:MAG: type II secretion system minor pseudopilin GspJ [Wenzhouxiangella sp.]